jgi:hypothetical protein
MEGVLAKLLLKLHQEPTINSQLWFHKTYGAGAGRDLGDKYYQDTSIWSTILKVLPFFRECTYTFHRDGRTTSFWYDRWLGEKPLAEALLLLGLLLMIHEPSSY